MVQRQCWVGRMEDWLVELSYASELDTDGFKVLVGEIILLDNILYIPWLWDSIVILSCLNRRGNKDCISLSELNGFKRRMDGFDGLAGVSVPCVRNFGGDT